MAKSANRPEEPDAYYTRAMDFTMVFLQLTEWRIFRLKVFYDEGVSHFDIGLDELKDQTDYLSPKEQDEFGDFYIDQFHELEELLKLKRYFCIVGLFTTFEMFLRAMLQLHISADAAGSKRIRRMNLDDMKEEFARLRVPITRVERDWHAIMGLKAVRNCITHAGGRANKERAKNLANYKIPVVDQSGMVLPEGYVVQSFDLVMRTCRRIAKDCQDKLMV